MGLHCFVRLDLAATGAARTAVGLLEAFRNELGHVGHVLGALQQVGFRLGGFSLGRSGFDLHERLFGGFNGLMNGLAAARLGLDVVGGLGLGRRLDLNEFRGADVHACEEILCGLEVFGGPGLDLSFRLGLRLFLGLHFVRSLDGSFGSGIGGRFGGAFGSLACGLAAATAAARTTAAGFALSFVDGFLAFGTNGFSFVGLRFLGHRFGGHLDNGGGLDFGLDLFLHLGSDFSLSGGGDLLGFGDDGLKGFGLCGLSFGFGRTTAAGAAALGAFALGLFDGFVTGVLSLRGGLGDRTAGGTLAALLLFDALFGLFSLVGLFLGAFRAAGAGGGVTTGVAAATAATAVFAAGVLGLFLAFGLVFLDLLFLFLLFILAAEEEAHDAREEALFLRDGLELGGLAGLGLGFLGLLRMHGSGIAREYVLDDGNLLRTLGLVLLALQGVRIVGHLGDVLGAVETRRRVFEALVVLTQALDVVVRRLELGVRDEHDGHAVACLKLRDVVALLVEEEGGDVDGNLRVHGARAFLHGLFLKDAQDLQGAAFRVADHADAVAARAGDVAAFGKGRTQALAGELHQAEAADLGHLDAGAVVLEGVLETLLDGALVLRVGHVDKVDHDEAAKVAQAHLAGHFVGSLAVGAEGRLLDVGAARGACGVDVDGDEGFRMVDHDRAAGGQRDRAGVGRFDLVFDLEAREERNVLTVALDAADHVGHDVRHELAGLFIDLVRVDEHFADVGLEVVADGAHDEVGFLNNQEGRRIGAAKRAAFDDARLDELRGAAAVFLAHELILRRSGFGDGLPELEEVVEVPLELFGRTADAGRAGDGGHAARQVELFHGLAQFLTFLAFNAAGDAATARIVRHEDEIAAGKADEGREGGALVAALFLFDLNDQFLTFRDGFADGGRTDVDAFLEVGAGDFLEGKEAVALFAVVDEAGFEAGLDAGHDALVDVGLAGFAAHGLDVDVDELLSIDDADAGFFRVRGIEKHALHGIALRPPLTRADFGVP